MTTPIIFGSGMPMALVALRYDEAGSGKYKMTASKLEIPISQLPEQI